MENRTVLYRYARPVWEMGAGKEKNVTLSFCTEICRTGEETEKTILYASAACSFLVLVNDEAVAHGPARTSHGFFRVDEVDLTPYLCPGKNRVVIRVTGYCVDSFAYLDQAPFFSGEIFSGDTCLAASGRQGFSVYRMTEKVQKVQRYSFQRPFVEVYRLKEGAFGYEKGEGGTEVTLEDVGDRVFLTRQAPYGDYEKRYPLAVVAAGAVSYSEKDSYYKNRTVTKITETDNQFTEAAVPNATGKDREKHFLSKGFKIENLDTVSFYEVGKMDFTPDGAVFGAPSALTIGRDRYVDVDMGVNLTGLFDFELDVVEDSEVYFLFDEVLVKGGINPFRIGSSNIFTVMAKKGTYHIVSAEPYVFRYLRIVSKGGAVSVRNLHLLEIAFPLSRVTARCTTEDPEIRKIYDAAVRTFAENTTDIYMDCPSRERAGWLCDSFFTSRVERTLTGRSDVEYDFLENFVLREDFPHLPEGMLPMCYPSDHNSGNYIPNWAMWYVLELAEYLRRTGDRTFLDRARKTAYGVYEWLKPFENEYGLLEKLEGWVFVEWSRANDLVQDVSFASNMLYASFLSALAEMYGDEEAEKKADALRTTIRAWSLTEAGYFCDNAVRQDGVLTLSGECTEACQYYAFFCDVATPESDPVLWETLVRDFGYDRRQTGKHKEIHFANAFIGNYLRLDLLCRYGYYDMLEANIRDYFGYMAERTGTLWEYEQDNKSCNHGFASHVLCWLEKLGYVQRA